MACHADGRGYEKSHGKSQGKSHGQSHGKNRSGSDGRSREDQGSERDDHAGVHEEDGQRYVSLAGLRARGWSGGMVHRLLGTPDRLSANPRLRAAPQVRLYRAERVEAAELSDEFQRVAESSARRSEAVRNAVRRRRLEILERIRTEPIEVPRLEPGKLALRAVEHRARQEAVTGARIELTDGDTARQTGQAGRASLTPWKVDYLRHRMSHYRQLLDGMPGGERDSGRAEAEELLRRRICAAIAEAYPALEQECERQTRAQ